jgi:hypothetical protein
MRLPVTLDERQDGVDRGFVGANQHTAAAQVAQIPDGSFRFLGQSQQPLRVIAQEPSGVGQRRILGRAIEQTLADALFEPPHRLAHCRLCTVQLHRRA